MQDTIIIDEKFCGYLNIGNGGYVCGMIANHIFSTTAKVTLWKPPPVNIPIDVVRIQNKVLLKNNDIIIAEGQSSSIDIDKIPSPPSFEEAVEASKLSFALSDNAPSPDCFVCGCNRNEDNGLRVFAGPVYNKNMVAAPFVPSPSLFDNSGNIRSEFLWAVLDCPGAYSFVEKQMPLMVLGRLVASVTKDIKPYEKCVVIGWQISTKGKKLFSGSALFSSSGELYGISKATWLPMKIQS